MKSVSRRRTLDGSVPDVTSPDLPAGRTIPDTDDLRLLAELINNEYIPLANAAWNAQMSQLEAATRLVEMAERGLPLRLVADGDRQQLWQIAQAGPATGAVGVPAAGSGAVGVAAVGSGVAEPSAPAPAPEVADAAPLAGGVAPAPAPTDTGSDGFGAPIVPAPAPFSAEPPPAAAPSAPLAPAVPPAPGPGYPQADAPGYPPAGSQTPYGTTVPPPVSDPIGSPVPPPAPVPPHEQAIAGAVPFGQPPFGQAPSAQSPLADPPAAPLAEPPSAEPTGAQAPAFEPAAAAAVEDTETAGQVAEAPAEDGPAAPADDAPSAAFAAPLSDPDATQVASSADFDRARAAGFAAAAGVAADETAVYRPGTADDEAEGETGVGSEGGRHASTDADVSGQGQPAPDDAAPAPAEPPPAPGVGATADPRSTWGVPGTASWARADTAEGSAEVAAASTLREIKGTDRRPTNPVRPPNSRNRPPAQFPRTWPQPPGWPRPVDTPRHSVDPYEPPAPAYAARHRPTKHLRHAVGPPSTWQARAASSWP